MIPDLTSPPSLHIRILCLHRKNYLLMNRESSYTTMFLCDKVNAPLEEMDRQVEVILFRMGDHVFSSKLAGCDIEILPKTFL